MNFVSALFALLLFGDLASSTRTAEKSKRRLQQCVREKIVIANRGSGTISLLNAQTGNVRRTIPLPYDTATETMPEPMYVVAANGKVYVGDKANNRIVAFNGQTGQVIAKIPAGAGVFHMWADARGKQLWVSNTVDNTLTVIDLTYNVPVRTVEAPALVGAGVIHDIVVSPNGDAAFATYLGDGGAVVKFDTTTFAVVASNTAVADDPHVSITFQDNVLYVPQQQGDQVSFLKESDLTDASPPVSITAAHGAGMAPDGRYFYTTNIEGGGTEAIHTIDTSTGTTVGSPVDANFATPHNLAHTGDRLFLTHSGATADKVSVYAVSNAAPVPVLLTDVTVGLNPFGLAYVPETCTW